MSLESKRKRITTKNKDKQMLQQIFDEKECAYKEDFSDLKTHLEEGMKF